MRSKRGKLFNLILVLTYIWIEKSFLMVEISRKPIFDSSATEDSQDTEVRLGLKIRGLV